MRTRLDFRSRRRSCDRCEQSGQGIFEGSSRRRFRAVRIARRSVRALAMIEPGSIILGWPNSRQGARFPRGSGVRCGQPPDPPERSLLGGRTPVGVKGASRRADDSEIGPLTPALVAGKAVLEAARPELRAGADRKNPASR